MANLPVRQQVKIEVEQQVAKNTHSHTLQMYNEVPFGCIKLEEMQQWCINRFRVLKLVDRISMRSYKKSSKQCLAILSKKLENSGLHDFAKLISEHDNEFHGEIQQQLKRNDCMSHFILRSAFSFEHQKRVWFFRQEVKLFKWRISSLDIESIEAFNHINGLQYAIVPEEETQKLQEDLKISCNLEDINNIKFYKVHFTTVNYLIAKRRIFLKDGIAYVPNTKISSLLLYEFKKILNKGFAYSRETASNVYDDERITNIFSMLSKFFNAQNFRYDSHRQVFISELDELSKTSYPLCMRVLHEALKTNHHLTNGGRVQYCLFLKGIGLNANNALQFWKDEFTKKIDEITFQKKYRYGVRHLYGQEGKRAKYDPFSCSKIFNSTLGVRDNHGCPFKHMTHDVLRKTLSKCGLVQLDIESVMQSSKEGSYLDACRKYYEISHNCITEKIFEHPNDYFNQSRKIIESTSDTED
ncbi:DNA primase large subunit [Calliopsis andreniformis]|uniref:DNA primase large subunit n=1 Tax=Calliopsis andreniformis TaxID=337506 RepID=UPI003FCC5D44